MQLSRFISVSDNGTGQLLSRCMKEGGQDECVCLSFCACLHVWDLKSLRRLHLFVRAPHSACLCRCISLQGGLTGCEWLSLLCSGGPPRGVKPSAAPISASNAQTWQDSVCVHKCVCVCLLVSLFLSFLTSAIQSFFDILGKLFCHEEEL